MGHYFETFWVLTQPEEPNDTDEAQHAEECEWADVRFSQRKGYNKVREHSQCIHPIQFLTHELSFGGRGDEPKDELDQEPVK